MGLLARVLVASLFGLHTAEFNSLLQEIDSDKPAIRKPDSQQVQRPAPSAAGIQDTDAVLKPLIEARNQRQNVAFSTGNTVCPLSSAMTLWKRSNRA